MPPLYDITADEWLEVNGVPLATPAFIAKTLEALNDDTPLRGENLPLYQATGRLGRQRFRDDSTRTIPLHIFGKLDWEGEPHTLWEQGLIDNYQHLKDNLGVADDNTDDDGAVEAIWHQPGGATKSALVYPQLIGFVKVSSFQARATLDLNLPDGDFAPTGS